MDGVCAGTAGIVGAREHRGGLLKLKGEGGCCGSCLCECSTVLGAMEILFLCLSGERSTGDGATAPR